MRPSRAPLRKMADDLHTLQIQRRDVALLTADHRWHVTHGPGFSPSMPQESSFAEFSRGVPSRESDLTRPPFRDRERIVSCVEEPNVTPRQLFKMDPCLMKADPLQQLKKQYQENVLEMPSKPPKPKPHCPTLSNNRDVVEAWRCDELPLSQWDFHPSRSNKFASTQTSTKSVANAHTHVALSALLAQSAKMNPGRHHPNGRR